MEQIFRLKKMVLLTLPLVVLIAISSIIGIFFENVYWQEVPEYAAQGIGQDIINLIVLVPILFVAAVLIIRGSKSWLFVWLGGLIYSVYSYTVYCFGVHFNVLFLVYCGILGLSFYLLIGFLISTDAETIKSWFDDKTPIKIPTVFLCVVAALFYVMWLSEVVPAIINGKVPESVKESGLITSPIHVLDIAIVLPGLIISAVLLKKKQALGYVLAPSFIIFAILMVLAIGGMIAVMSFRGFDVDLSLTIIFALIAIVSGVVFIAFTKHLKKLKG